MTSRLAVGCGANAGLMVSDDHERIRAVVDAALGLGIAWFDTAGAYGSGRSEINLGKALRSADLGPTARISTKVLIDSEELSDVRGAVQRAVEGSLRRLRRDHVDVLLLHNRVGWWRQARPAIGIGPVLSLDDVLGPKGVAESFHELMADGVVEQSGFTTYGAEQSAVDELLASDRFQVINAACSLVNPSAAFALEVHGEPDFRSVIDRAAAHSVGVTAFRVLEGGKLARPGSEKITRLQRWCTEHAGSVVAGALRFVLANPAIATVVMGFTEVHHVRAAVEVERLGPLPPEMMSEARRLVHTLSTTADPSPSPAT